ncbi:hypothetical protein [Bradyrhizobium sp. ORS 111]|uniref:hypothetical protein n=1 Tax=Bradyrhizobium sp. ORS 111 TaxID=1685958 RepID=UPI00388CF125
MAKGKEMIPFGAAIAGDVLSVLQMPGGGFLGKLGDKYLERKQREAAEILIAEVSNGSAGPIEFSGRETDPLIEIIYRFSKAVSDGAARENLRLLAKIIAGLKKNKALDPDKFRRWANILEQLTRDELMVIGKAIAIRRKIVAGGPEAANDFWQRLEVELKASGYNPDEIGPLCTSVSRTGLLIPMSAWGGTVYIASPWIEELGDLADVEAIIAAK